MERTVKITVCGRDYWMKTDLTDKELSEVVAYLEEKLTILEHTLADMPREKVLLLAALHLALELYEERKLREEAENKLKALEKKVEMLL